MLYSTGNQPFAIGVLNTPQNKWQDQDNSGVIGEFIVFRVGIPLKFINQAATF